MIKSFFSVSFEVTEEEAVVVVPDTVVVVVLPELPEVEDVEVPLPCSLPLAVVCEVLWVNVEA